MMDFHRRKRIFSIFAKVDGDRGNGVLGRFFLYFYFCIFDARFFVLLYNANEKVFICDGREEDL